MMYRLDITARLHRRMLEIVSTALPLITQSQTDADLAGLAHLRGEMIETLEAYCHHVDRLAAPALMEGCTDLRAAYDAFRARWVHRDGMVHWHEYRLSAVVMMKRVRTLVEAAERHPAGWTQAGAQAN